MKKLMTIDLDGTLLNSKKEVSLYTRRVIQEAIAAEHCICLCSGRPYSSMIQLVDELDMNISGAYTICYNGGMIFENSTKEPIYQAYLNMESFYQVWDLATEAGLYPQSYSLDSVVVDQDNADVRDYAQRIKIKALVVDNIRTFKELTPHKIVIIDSKQPERLHHFREKYQDTIRKDTYGIFTEKTLLEYIPADVSKGNALIRLADILGVDMKNTYAIGDAENDLSMIETATTGIAMANGIDLIKEKAQVILEKTNDEDGVAFAIEKYILEKDTK